MKVFSVLLTLAAPFLSASHLNSQTLNNPLRVPAIQDPISVFAGDVNGDRVTDLPYEISDNSITSGSMNNIFGQPSGGYIAGPALTLPTTTPNPATADQAVTLSVTVANPPESSIAAAYNTAFSVTGMHTLTTSYSGEALRKATTASVSEQLESAQIGGAGAGDWTWMGGSGTWW